MEFVDPSRMRDIDKNDRCVINEAARRDRPRECVLHRSVRPARARATLRALDGLFFRGVLPG